MRFGGNGYLGSSFFALLQAEHPEMLPDFSAWAASSAVAIPHGTTVLALKYTDGVLVAGDRLATEGHRVASRDVQKVYRTDEHSVMAISGAAGPSIEMARLLGIELEHYEKIEGEGLELEGKANKLSQMIRQNLPAAMQGLVVVPLYAGYDRRRKLGRLWKFDVTGGRYEEANFEATGSGGLYAQESLKKSWNGRLGADEALDAAVEALTDAADEDRHTGGIDLARRIFPVVKTCTADGVKDVPEQEIEPRYHRILERRQQRSAS